MIQSAVDRPRRTLAVSTEIPGTCCICRHLEQVAVFGDLAQLLNPCYPWHGRRIVILARNNPRQACLRCENPPTGGPPRSSTNTRSTTTSSTRAREC